MEGAGATGEDTVFKRTGICQYHIENLEDYLEVWLLLIV